MKIIIRPPKTGKTQELIEESAKNGGVIICRDWGRVKAIQTLAWDKGLNIPNPIPVDIFIEDYTEGKGEGIKEFYIDRVEECLQRITSFPIKIITAQSERK